MGDRVLLEADVLQARQQKAAFASKAAESAQRIIKSELRNERDYANWKWEMEFAIKSYKKKLLAFDDDEDFDESVFVGWAVASFGTAPQDWYRAALGREPELEISWELLSSRLNSMYDDPTQKFTDFSTFRRLIMPPNMTLAEYDAQFDRLSTCVKLDETTLVAFYIDGLLPVLCTRTREFFPMGKPTTMADVKEKAKHLNLDNIRERTDTRVQQQHSQRLYGEGSSSRGGKRMENKNGGGGKSPDSQLQGNLLRKCPEYPHYWPSTLRGWTQGPPNSDGDKLSKFCRHNHLCFKCKWEGHMVKDCRGRQFGEQPSN